MGEQLMVQTLSVSMDYGYFVLCDGGDPPANDIELLRRAQAHPPSASDGRSVLISSPHQNNFDMIIEVQVWDERPPEDRDAWQQVSENLLRIAGAELMYVSPTMGEASCVVPPGRYLAEVSGRGFVNYGWPGSTQPGDQWRVRLWPAGSDRPRPAQQWHQPGYGTPPPVPYPQPASGTITPVADSPGYIREAGVEDLSDEQRRFREDYYRRGETVQARGGELVTKDDFGWWTEQFGWWENAGYCITLFRDLPASEVLAGLRAEPCGLSHGIAELAETSARLRAEQGGRQLVVGVADLADWAGWTLMVEVGGNIGDTRRLIGPLSPGRMIVSNWRSSDDRARFSYWNDRTLMFGFDPHHPDDRHGADRDGIWFTMMQQIGLDLGQPAGSAGTFALAERIPSISGSTPTTFTDSTFLLGRVTLPDNDDLRHYDDRLEAGWMHPYDWDDHRE
ncbi:hypothetical protein KXR83_19360 [Williamsia muralis]|uniref:DUF6461 domain-containing protein n=1 Tax=Williamsia marianensis TaxID=85044 RepID=UPI003F16BEE0